MRKRRLGSILISAALIVILAVFLINLKEGSSRAPADAVALSEIMISNKGSVPDETGDFPDWIEVYNNTDSPLDISGFGLTDELISAAKWTFPEGAVIPARGYLVVFCSGDPTRGTMHTPFKLSASDDVILSNVSGTQVEEYTVEILKSE